MSTIKDLQQIVFNHTYEVMRDRNLPPGCIDINAQIEAERFVYKYTNENRLTDFFYRYMRGAL